VHALAPELADEAAGAVLAAAGASTIVTYCMACKDRFLAKGSRALHILELLVSTRFVERPVSSARKWINRFLLALSSRLKETSSR
jgi:hypothetical protein